MNKASWQVVVADCVEYLRTLPENSLDSCVCDPPYGLAELPAADVARVEALLRRAGLPLTGPHGEVYTWDTTVLDPSGRGNFFVARVAMPLGDLAVPEPAVLLLVGSGLLALGFARRRK